MPKTVPASADPLKPGGRASRPAVFIDEDTALLSALPDGPDATPELRPQAQAALTALSAHGYALVLLCSDAGRWLTRLSGSELILHQKRLQHLIEADGEAGVTDVMACPHLPGVDGKPVCDCHLPRPGLLLEAARRHDFALDRSWLIAGGKRGRRAARRAGCRSVRMGAGPKSDTDDLMKAARLILAEHDPIGAAV